MPGDSGALVVRQAGAADAPALAAIYGHYALHEFGTFEEETPSPAEMARRIAAVTALGLPYLVAEKEAVVLGFAYAAPFRPRAAYRYTVEDSVYVAPGAQGRGVGRALVQRLIEICQAMGLRQMMAVIGDSGNAASIGLHRSLGFAPAGVCRAVGFKHGRWVDTVRMQRALNDGDASAPSAPGLELRGH
ncbi:MAG: N-acetyltransferase [Caulobacteraceae bacterium]|nr:N-acetyltransferase [Caulobacteraceae bacterium]